MARSKNLKHRGRAAVTELTEQRRYIAELQHETCLKEQEERKAIHDGLLHTLQRHDPDWQAHINLCDDYPFTLYYSRPEEMEVVFAALSRLIENAIHGEEGCTCSDLLQSGLQHSGSVCSFCESQNYKLNDDDLIF